MTYMIMIYRSIKKIINAYDLNENTFDEIILAVFNDIEKV